MALCLTIGRAPCLYEWGVISETMCDLATAIIFNNKWNPNNLHVPNQENSPPPKFMHNYLPFGIGNKLIVNVNVNPQGIHNIYNDDLIGLGLDLPDCRNIKQSK
jgi:hypothetical protein